MNKFHNCKIPYKIYNYHIKINYTIRKIKFNINSVNLYDPDDEAIIPPRNKVGFTNLFPKYVIIKPNNPKKGYK